MAQYEPFLINPHKSGHKRRRKSRVRHRVKGRVRRRMSALQRRFFGPRRRKRRFKRNLAGSLMIVGNPRKGVKSMAKRRRKHAKRRRHRSRGFFSMNPRRRSYRKHRRTNRHRSYRRHRRYSSNPSVPALALNRPMTLLPVIITGGLSAIATTAAPAMLSKVLPGYETNPFFVYGSKLVSAFGGGYVISRFVGRKHGVIWTVVGVALIGAELVNKFLLAPAGFAAYPLGYDVYGYSPEMSGMGYEGGAPGSDFFLPNRADEGVPLGAYTSEFAY